MDSPFPVSECCGCPEGSPIEDPEEVRDQGEEQQEKDPDLLFLSFLYFYFTGSLSHRRYTKMNRGRLKSALARQERAASEEAAMYSLGRALSSLSISLSL